MKYSYLFLFIAIFFAACGQAGKNAENMSIEELKAEINEKKSQIKELEREMQVYEVALEKKDTVNHIETINVSVDTVTRNDFVHHVDIQSIVESEDQVYASAEMGGSITRLNVEEGQYVKKGTLIAKVDASSMSAQRDELENQLALAKDLYNRQKKLWDQKIGTEVQYVQAKNNVESIEKSLNTLETNMRRSNIYAPKSGVVDQIMVKQGEFAGPGSPIALIISNNRLKVVAEVPEKYLPNIKKGQEVSIRFPNLGISQKSKIKLVGTSINQGNRTFKVEAPIDLDKDRLIKPNLLAMMEIVDYRREDVITLPSKLVQQEVNGDNFVIVAHKDSEGNYISEKTKVETGKYFNDAVIIESGLSEGDLIVISGARGLSSGVYLQPLNSDEVKTLFGTK